MPTRYVQKNVETVTSTADSLRTVAEQLTSVAQEMQKHGMPDALLPWTQRQWDCLDRVITLGNQCVAAFPAQIMAKAQNRPSMYEVSKKKSERDVAARKARLEGSTLEPRRPRGRPRKPAN